MRLLDYDNDCCYSVFSFLFTLLRTVSVGLWACKVCTTPVPTVLQSPPKELARALGSDSKVRIGTTY
jgi:hypothetical protein